MTKEPDYPNYWDHPIPDPKKWSEAFSDTIHCIVLFPDGHYVICDDIGADGPGTCVYDGVRVSMGGDAYVCWRKKDTEPFGTE